MRTLHHVVVLVVLACLALVGCRTPQVEAPPHSPIKITSSPPPRAFPNPLVVSVYSFENRTRQPQFDWLRAGIPDLLVATFAGSSIPVIQRDRLEEILREQAFQLSGRVADTSVVRIGRLVGATVLVTGSLRAQDGMLQIDGQVLTVEQGLVLATASVQGPEEPAADVVQAFISTVKALFPHTATAMTGGVTPDLASIQANTMGERFARQGKLFEALEEFERAMAANPRDPTARANYGRTIQALPPAELLMAGSGDDTLVAGRLVERLLSGMNMEIGSPAVTTPGDEAVTVRVPVRLGIARSAVAQFLEAVRRAGATTTEQPGGSIDIRSSVSAGLVAELVKKLGEPRRVYLRLLAVDGRTIGIFSDFLQWKGSTWITVQGPGAATIHAHKVVDGAAVFTELTREQLRAATAVAMTVEPVPRERAVVRVEVAAVAESARERQSVKGRDSGELDRKTRAASQILSRWMAESWNPPIAERIWSPGHLPGNASTATVMAILDPENGLQEPARLVRRSGQTDFDQACLAAFSDVLRRLALAHPSSVLPVPQRDADATDGGSNGRVQSTLRAQCELHKDLPLLNVVGAQGTAHHLAPPLFQDSHP